MGDEHKESLKKLRRNLDTQAREILSDRHPGEFVYVFRDQLNLNLIKVGFSNNPIRRRSELHTTATARPHEIYYVWQVDNMKKAETAVHGFLEEHRVNPKREYFELFLFQEPDINFRCVDTMNVCLDKLIELIEEDAFYPCDIKWTQVTNPAEILEPADIEWIT